MIEYKFEDELSKKFNTAIIPYVYDEDFNSLGMLQNYESLIWSEDYYGKGEFQIVCVDNKENIRLLKQGRYIYRKDRDTAMVIRHIKYDTQLNYITINGYTTNDNIARRIIYRTQKIKNIEQGMYDIITNNLRGMPRQTVAALKGFTETFDTQFTGENCLEACVKLSEQSKIGFKNVFDYKNKQHVFTAYKGRNLAYGNTEGNQPKIFSAEFRNLNNMILIDDMSIFKNVAYVAGFGEGDERTWIEIGNASGLNRYELFVDARDIQINEEIEETIEQYKSRLYARGIQMLNEYIRQHTFIGSISPLRFGIDFDIGDIVSCKSDKYDVKIDTRIMRYEIRRENKVVTLNLTLGEPRISPQRQVKLWQ